MITLSTDSIKALGEVITGNGRRSPYRSGPALVAFFNQFGANDTYPRGGGFPSRWKYAEEKLEGFNGTDTIERILLAALEPADFEDTEFSVQDCVDHLNDHLGRDALVIFDNGSRLELLNEQADMEDDEEWSDEFGGGDGAPLLRRFEDWLTDRAGQDDWSAYAPRSRGSASYLLSRSTGKRALIRDWTTDTPINATRVERALNEDFYRRKYIDLVILYAPFRFTTPAVRLRRYSGGSCAFAEDDHITVPPEDASGAENRLVEFFGQFLREDLDGDDGYEFSEGINPPALSSDLPSVLVGASAAPDAHPHKARCLVIGNAEYVDPTARLANPGHDAIGVSRVLQQLGHDVALVRDASKKELAAKLREFSKSLTPDAGAVVYFSGHGLEVNGINYVVPVDFEAHQDWEVEHEAIDVRRLLDSTRNAAFRVVVLDACRSTFYRRFRGGVGSSVFKPMNAEVPETALWFATGQGKVALDGVPGQMSPFTDAFTNHLRNSGGRDLHQVMMAVRSAVLESTRKQQLSWTNDCMTKPWYPAG